MRHGRGKKARKTLQFYELNYKIQPPYQVILDGNFIVQSFSYKLPIIERVYKLLQQSFFHNKSNHEQSTNLVEKKLNDQSGGSAQQSKKSGVEFYITRETIEELTLLNNAKSSNSSTNNVIFQQARQFGLDECKILEPKAKANNDQSSIENKPSSKKVTSHHPVDASTNSVLNHVLHDTNKFMVATQDTELAQILRSKPNIPLIYLSRGVLLLEGPSKASKHQSIETEKLKQEDGGVVRMGLEKEWIQRVNKGNKEADNNNSRYQYGREHLNERRKRKAKGPNPLSCKKKKTSSSSKSGGK
jgi:U3 small nucleolar RNA-associated protein 23